MPIEAFEHLILSLGQGGAYGGQTSVTGVNLRTHIAGIYASLVERPETSPYEIVRFLTSETTEFPSSAISEAMAVVHEYLAASHQLSIGRDEAEAWRKLLVSELVSGSDRLKKSYVSAHAAVADLFDLWFTDKGRSTLNTRPAPRSLPQEAAS
jgi:hypothetical protein